jgi:GTP-binding protein HflX
LAQLAASAGAEVASASVQTRVAPEAATLIGRGKVQELAAEVKSENAALVIFDHDLSPTQQRNLEKSIDARILTRTQLILDIFAARARTREGRLQVELAQLTYLLPRLAGRGIEMSRLGGGIGTRGPGETQLETDRRKIGRRIKKLKDDLESVRAGRALHRKRRTAVPLATLALAGYTNAGKSTLFNRLTRAGVTADARMFATLDPTVRPFDLPSRRRVLFSDTVGFIRNLPPALVKAFRATLEEVTEASLILHVVDASAPDAKGRAQLVEEVLAEIDAAAIPRILVLNKIDRLEPGSDPNALSRHLTSGGDAFTAPVSAATGEGIPELLAAIDRLLPLDPIVRARFRLPPGGGPVLATLHEFGRVIETRFEADGCEVEAEIPESLERRLRRNERG